MANAYTTFNMGAEAFDIEDKDAEAFWKKNFQEKEAVTIGDFTDPIMKEFPGNNSKVLRVLCKYIICCSADANTKDVAAQDLDRFVKRFGPFKDCITNAQKFFFKENPREEGDSKFKLKEWYHGRLDDTKQKILENPDKFLVREPKQKDKWNLLTLEYSKSFEKDGKKLLARNKKHIIFDKKNGLYVWKTSTGAMSGAKDIDVALKAMMNNKREPIKSAMWHAEENQSLYQAASYEYE